MDFRKIYVEYMPIFYSMLYCYQNFVTQLEGDHVPAAYIWPLFQSFKEQSQLVLSLADSLNIKASSYIKDLVEKISIRLERTYSPTLLKYNKTNSLYNKLVIETNRKKSMLENQKNTFSSF